MEKKRKHFVVMGKIESLKKNVGNYYETALSRTECSVFVLYFWRGKIKISNE